MVQVNALNLSKDSIQELISLFEQLGYPQHVREFEIRLEEFLQNPGYGIALAYENNKAIGMVAWTKSMTLVTNKTRLRIEGLVVDLDHRNKGVGKQLMYYVEDFARQFSPCIIELTSGARRAVDGSHDFYNAIGYKNSGDTEKLYFRKEV